MDLKSKNIPKARQTMPPVTNNLFKVVPLKRKISRSETSNVTEVKVEATRISNDDSIEIIGDDDNSSALVKAEHKLHDAYKNVISCHSSTGKNSAASAILAPKLRKHQFTRKLISLVRAQPMLYDVHHYEFSNAVAKNEAWCKIAMEVGSAAETCQNSWADLRHEYQKYVRQLRLFGEHATCTSTTGVSDEQMKLLDRKFLQRNGSRISRPYMRYELELMFLYRFIKPVAHANRQTAATLTGIGALSSSDYFQNETNVSGLARGDSNTKDQTKVIDDDDDDVVLLKYSEPYVIDLDDEMHRIAPYKMTSHVRTLVSAVLAYPELYDVDHRYYHNYRRRGIIWSGIAAELKDKATKLLKIWLQIITRYEWELCVAHTSEHNSSAKLKPSALQEQLSDLEHHIKKNQHTILKQSNFLQKDWYDPIEHFKTVVCLLDTLRQNPEIVQLTDASLNKTKKPSSYNDLWANVAKNVGISVEQCEVTWLLLRSFYWELVELRKVGYYLQDKWFFESVIGTLYEAVNNWTTRTTNKSGKKDSSMINKATSTVGLVAASTTISQTSMVSISSLTTSVPSSMSTVTANVRPTKEVGVATQILSAPTPLPNLVTLPKLMTTCTSTPLALQSASSNVPYKTTATVTSAAQLNAETQLSNAVNYRLPQITSAISLAPLLSGGTIPLPMSPTLSPVIIGASSTSNSQIIPLQTSMPLITPVQVPSSSLVISQASSYGPRPNVTLSVRPSRFPGSYTLGGASRSILLPSGVLSPPNIYVRPVTPTAATTSTVNSAAHASFTNILSGHVIPSNAQVRPIQSPSTAIRPQTFSAPIPESTAMPTSQTKLQQPQQQITLTAPPLTSLSTSINVVKTIPITTSIPLIQNSNTSIAIVQTKGVDKEPNTTNVTHSKLTPVSTPSSTASMSFNPSVISNQTTEDVNMTNKPISKPFSCALTLPAERISASALTPSEPSSTSQLQIMHASSLLNSNEIMIELISSNKGKHLVVHGPPLAVKYTLTMPKTANLIREIMAIPLLHNKQPSRLRKVAEYWQYIAKKFNLPVHVCKACWNFLADNVSHFPRIAPMSELMRPFKNGLKVWEKSHTLFSSFNETALNKGWLGLSDDLQGLMRLTSKYRFLYADITRLNEVEPPASAEMVQAVWNTARVMYPSIAYPFDAWNSFKCIFIQYMDDLEEGIDNPWPQNWWRVLEQLIFVADLRYKQIEPFYYIVHNKLRDELQRCSTYEQLMQNSGTLPMPLIVTTNVMQTNVDILDNIPNNIIINGSATNAKKKTTNIFDGTNDATAFLMTQKASGLSKTSKGHWKQRSIPGNFDAYHLFRIIYLNPVIYENYSKYEKTNAWMQVASEMKTTANDCYLTMQNAMRKFRVYKTRDPASRCRLNQKYYKFLTEIYRNVKPHSRRDNATKKNELNPFSVEPSDPVFPERYIPEINLHTSNVPLVMKNWAFAAGNIANDDLYYKIFNLFSKYRTASLVNQAQ